MLTNLLFAFGPDPVGIRVASCLHSISWTNGWILTKLAQTHYWEGGKKLLDFGDLDLIFKVTPALWNFQILTKNACLHPISWTKWQILVKLHILWHWDGLKIWLDFDDLDPKTVKIRLVCTLSPEPNGKEMIRFWWSWPLFKVTPALWMSNFNQKKLVCILSLDSNDRFWPNFMYCIIGIIFKDTTL